MSTNPHMERSDRLANLAHRLRRTKKISEADAQLLYEASGAAWDDAIHFAAPWDKRVSLCGNWGRNLIEIDDKGDVGGTRCWTCLHTRDWLVKNLPTKKGNRMFIALIKRTRREKLRFYTSWHYIRQTRLVLPLWMWWANRGNT